MNGFIFAFSAMILNGVGALFLKKGIDLLPNEPTRAKLAAMHSMVFLFKNKFWLIGGVLLVFAWLLRTIAVNLVDLSYVRTVLDAHLLIVVIGSGLWIKEKITPSIIVSTLLIVAGLFLLALGPSLTRNPRSNSMTLLVFLLIITIFGISSVIISFRFKNIQKFCFGVCAAMFYTDGVLIQAFFSVTMLNTGTLLDLSYYLWLASQPILYVMALFIILGFIFSNLMINKLNLSIIYPIEHPLSEIFILLGSIIIFGDDISITSDPFRFMAIALTLAGLCLISYKNRSLLFNERKKFPGEGETHH